MDAYSSKLLVAVRAVAETWLSRAFDKVVSEQGLVVDPHGRLAAVIRARDEATDRLEELLRTDVIEQRTNPLSILRSVTRHLTVELLARGARPIEQDEFHRRTFPDDVFGLCPATWADIDPSLADCGIEWGAWKAAEVLRRRRTR